MHDQHRFFGRPVGVMHEERPTEPLRQLQKIGAMALEPLLILLAQRLGAAGDHAVPAFACGKLGTPRVRQRLLGRIEHLNEMAAHALRRDRLQTIGGGADRLQEIAEQAGIRRSG